jgi:hypothetical protein
LQEPLPVARPYLGGQGGNGRRPTFSQPKIKNLFSYPLQNAAGVFKLFHQEPPSARSVVKTAAYPSPIPKISATEREKRLYALLRQEFGTPHFSKEEKETKKKPGEHPGQKVTSDSPHITHKMFRL